MHVNSLMKCSSLVCNLYGPEYMNLIDVLGSNDMNDYVSYFIK